MCLHPPSQSHVKSIILLLMLIPTKNLSSDVAAYAGSYTKADISADVLSSMFRLKRYRCYRDGADINERSHKPTSGASKSATLTVGQRKPRAVPSVKSKARRPVDDDRNNAREHNVRGQATGVAKPPSERMVAFARRVAADKKAKLPLGFDTDFEICRRFLDRSVRQ